MIQNKKCYSSLNLFEILTGLQLLLHKKYGFIPELNLTKDLDIVFCIWKIQYDFITVNENTHNDQFDTYYSWNQFIHK